jgi:L-lactate utilization protein LutB
MNTTSYKQAFYEAQAEEIIKKLNARNMEGYYCADREEASAKVKRFLTPDSSIAWGGSMTMEEIGLLDDLRESDYELIDRNMAVTPEEKRELFGKIVTADYFLMSTNAITLDGELINIDGNGNRVACLCQGPEQVIIVAGMNKVVADVEAGIQRVHNIAAPPNALRLGLDTPCANFGRCSLCLSKECMCAQTVVTRYNRIDGRIKVILVGEELGF